MTGDAVDGRLLLLMTCDTETHRMVDNAFCIRHAPDIPVAFPTGYRSRKMRGMVEAHMRFIIPSINSLPGNFFSAIEICGNLLHRRLVFGDGVVTRHTPPDSWNNGAWAGECAGVAIQALHLGLLQMRLVVVGNRLHGGWPESKEVASSHRYAGVRRSENAR